jgi:hypothetical protein
MVSSGVEVDEVEVGREEEEDVGALIATGWQTSVLKIEHTAVSSTTANCPIAIGGCERTFAE